MELKALSQGTGGASSVVSALPSAVSIPADSRAVVADVSTSTELTDSERTQLVQAVAAVDAGISSPSLRSDVLEHVSRLGFYLKNTSDEGWPRWNVLTGLRVYGLNLDASTQGAPSAAAQPQAPQPDEQVVAQQVKAKLDGVARSSRGVSLEHVAAAVKTAKSAPVASAKSAAGHADGHTVEVVA